ncbi:acyl-CoA dehydrogenase family protein [Nocardioides sp. BYT-33-1]|uniref:acyl-CoA dehydrogenase family protein n=1 Tax=Nocardioides sp. BYT-33-1 TaxID=3416952 RepID=UPI003F532EBB
MAGLVLSAELSPVFARFLDQRSPVEVSRLGGAALPELWTGLVEEVGAAGLLVEDEYGGQGASLTELAAAVAETARCGWSGPLVAASGVGATLLRRVDPADAAGLRRALAEEGRVVVPALHEDGAGLALDAAARLDGAGATLTVRGRKTFVDSGTHADAFLVTATGAGGDVELVLVDAGAAGVRVSAMEAVDPGRGMALLDLDDAPAIPLAAGPQVSAAVRDAWLVGALLTAVDALAAADRAFRLARDYAVDRQQFGRPVASFQSIKHKLVDMYAELETATSAVLAAVAAAGEGADDWRFAASAAKVRAGDAAMFVLREAVQVHGGIGFTWEHEISHHFRRVTAARALYGTPSAHRALVAAERGF